jgi:hypothetical protein
LLVELASYTELVENLIEENSTQSKNLKAVLEKLETEISSFSI